MDEKTIASVIFLKTAKEIWDTLKEMHSNKQNISFVGMHLLQQRVQLPMMIGWLVTVA